MANANRAAAMRATGLRNRIGAFDASALTKTFALMPGRHGFSAVVAGHDVVRLELVDIHRRGFPIVEVPWDQLVRMGEDAQHLRGVPTYYARRPHGNGQHSDFFIRLWPPPLHAWTVVAHYVKHNRGSFGHPKSDEG